MKPKLVKLPCCEINKNSDQNTVGCVYCECFFEKQELADQHVHEIHKEKVEVKRIWKCCEKRGFNGRFQSSRFKSFSCPHCECILGTKGERRQHILSVHKCHKCRELIESDYQRVQHKIKHEKEEELRKQEQQKREESKKKRQQMDDDLVLNYLKKNKLDEYQLPPDHEPDFDYIFTNHLFTLEKEEMLAMVKKFNIDIFNEIYAYPLTECVTADEIIYLLENGAFGIKDVVEWMDSLACNIFVDDAIGEMLAYFLNKDYEIKPEWIAALITTHYHERNQLIERIKEKYTFTFDQIYDARDKEYFNTDMNKDAIDEFYVNVHEHFPDPDFEDPFADPYDHFKSVKTKHVQDHLHQRYFYDEEEDKLSIVVGYGENEREILLGSCKEMLKRSLEDLIEQYEKEIKVYDELNAEVSKGFAEMDEIDDDDISREQRAYRKEDIYKGYLRDDIYCRNDQANIVSILYYAIFMKTKDDTETEANDDAEQKEKGKARTFPLTPFGQRYISFDDKFEKKDLKENEAKQWSVTIRRSDGSIIPLSSIKSHLNRTSTHQNSKTEIMLPSLDYKAPQSQQ